MKGNARAPALPGGPAAAENSPASLIFGLLWDKLVIPGFARIDMLRARCYDAR